MKSEDAEVSFGRVCRYFFLSFRLHLTLVFADHRHHSMQNAMENVVVALDGDGRGELVPYCRF